MHFDLEKQLKKRFNWDAFRPGQKEILQTLLGGKSTLGLMPTGSGKSLIYQMFSDLKEGVTLCVSPLIALMEDQSQKARSLGLKASFIHSQVSAEEKRKRLKEFSEGHYRLFFVTPERLQKPEFQEAIKSVTLALFVVDEAHCISLWGHDFRPDYAKLGAIQKAWGMPLTLALTATATADVQVEIQKSLSIASDSIISSGMKRDNLEIAVEEHYGLEAKLQRVLPDIKSRHGAMLIYVTLIRSAEEIYRELRKAGLDPLIYHGELEPQKRKSNMKKFMSQESPLMVATPAFGLGIDKPNIRAVYHFEPPSSIESYFQEVGRAGRDGNPAQGLFLYDEEDLTIPMQFIKSAHPEESFIRKVFHLIEKNPDRVKSEGEAFLVEQMTFKNRSDHRVSAALGILERWGCLSQDKEKIEITSELKEEFFQQESQVELMKHHNLKLYSLVKWIRNQEICRLVQIYEYFGIKEHEPCGRCDVCRREKYK